MNIWVFLSGIGVGVGIFIIATVLTTSLYSRREYGTWGGWLSRPGPRTQAHIARRCLKRISDGIVTGKPDTIFVTEAQAFKAWATDALAAMEFGESAVRRVDSAAMQHIEEIRKTVK